MLHNELLPFCEIEDKKTIFQHYNTPIHTIATTENWFQDFEIELLPWPVLNIDLNPIENLWGRKKSLRSGEATYLRKYR